MKANLHLDSQDLPDALKEDMDKKRIDIDLTLTILNDYNAGLYDDVKQVVATGVPAIDGRRVIDTRGRHRKDAIVFTLREDEARANLAKFGIPLIPATTISNGDRDMEPGMVGFTAQDLESIGAALLPMTGYGVLNGGSATSYADSKKNLALGEDVFAALAEPFEKMASRCKNRPKGLTPAYLNPDGSAGASFLELKMRARLQAFAKLKVVGTRNPAIAAALSAQTEFLPLFQMTSSGNNDELAAAYDAMTTSPFLGPLSQSLGIEPTKWHTGVQNMIAAYTHSSEGRPKRIFDHAYGRKNSSLPLPGGHGQCFHVLAGVLNELYAKGIRFAYIGNVDNVAYTPDPLELGLLALSGKPAGFEFSVRTAMDVKGGILVQTDNGGCTVADIGPAIGFDDVLRLENEGNSILFNCAVGLFDLSYLVPHLEELSRRLPVRFTDQDKDAGRYSQAEQVTWEVMGCLPSFLAFAVDKNERFLAAKLLVDTLLTSGLGIEDDRLSPALRKTAQGLHAGLVALLEKTYGLVLSDGKWVPQELELQNR